MSSSKRFLYSILLVTLTIITSLCIYYNFRSNSYKVVINNKETVYVKSIEDIQKARDTASSYLLERFVKGFGDDVVVNKANIPQYKISNVDDLVKAIYKSIDVEALQLKSDGKDIAILANEQEIQSFIKSIKSKVKERSENISSVNIKNKITYVKKVVSLDSVDNIENVANKLLSEKEGESVIAFNIVNKDDNLTLLTAAPSNKETNKNIENEKAAPVSSSVETFSIPTKGIISSAFGMRYHPILGYNKMHTGVDLAAPTGTPILSPFDGVVSFSGVMDGYGNTIVLKNGNMEVYFGHCSQLLVKVNQQVHIGDMIAKVGSTGQSTGPHLHFEVRIDGKPQDPMKYVK